MKPEKPVLDYATPSREREYARTEDDDRRDAVARYNEAEFGEAHPFGGPLLRRAVYLLIVAAIVVLLPRDIARPLAWLTGVGLIIWEGWIER